MKRKIVIGIFVGILLLGVAFANLDTISNIIKEDKTLKSNLATNQKDWIKQNINDASWEGNIEVVDDNLYRMNFCYEYDDREICDKYVLIADYAKESLYCFSYNETDESECLVWNNVPLKDMLDERYLKVADDVMSRVYRTYNNPVPTDKDVGKKTIDYS